MSGSGIAIAALALVFSLSWIVRPAQAQAPSESSERDQAGDRQASSSSESAQLKEGQDQSTGSREPQAEKRASDVKPEQAHDNRPDRPARPERPDRPARPERPPRPERFHR